MFYLLTQNRFVCLHASSKVLNIRLRLTWNCFYFIPMFQYNFKCNSRIANETLNTSREVCVSDFTCDEWISESEQQLPMLFPCFERYVFWEHFTYLLSNFILTFVLTSYCRFLLLKL